jgi:hypothetical protein
VPILRVGSRRDGEQDDFELDLLALPGLRRDLEPRTGEHRILNAPTAMVAPPSTPEIETLRELIEALDRRVPRLERTGEIAIARDAATLRKQAVARIAELERTRE